MLKCYLFGWILYYFAMNMHYYTRCFFAHPVVQTFSWVTQVFMFYYWLIHLGLQVALLKRYWPIFFRIILSYNMCSGCIEKTFTTIIIMLGFIWHELWADIFCNKGLLCVHLCFHVWHGTILMYIYQVVSMHTCMSTTFGYKWAQWKLFSSWLAQLMDF